MSPTASTPPSVQIKYSIAGCSEHSGRYVAENIKVDRPRDQTSRWSSVKDNAVNGKSWILIELEAVAVLESITFGKFQKSHPCNMKEFEVHLGMSRDHMTEVLRSSLKNDSKSETFPLPYRSKDSVSFPTRFVKIVSLSAHGHNFNTSIWYVALSGIVDEQYVRQITDAYENDRETAAMRHILKHLRQRRHMTTYRQLLARSGVQVEHPLVSILYDTLVLRGDWASSEAHLRSLAAVGLFSGYIHACTPRARWTRLHGVDANGDTPSARGGHAMCLDAGAGLLYLFGGYDGRKSLDDFWVYNLRERRWKVISHNAVGETNEPGPRSCHKMVFDPKTDCIYMLGRLGDGDIPTTGRGEGAQPSGGTSTNLSAEGGSQSEPPQGQVQSAWRTMGQPRPTEMAPPQPSTSRPQTHDYFSELYRYRTRGLGHGKWELVSVDTAIVGGPKLVYDHQLILDSEAQILYVQGGRVVDGDWATRKYSGLYSYDIREGKWTMIQANSPEAVFPPRFGHSTVFEPFQKKLFIVAGQKDEYLSDMWEYDIQSRTMSELFQNVTTVGGPEACFAQRAVIDPKLKEVYVFAGLSKRNSHLAPAFPGLPVSLYKYDTRPGTWTRVPTAAAENAKASSAKSSVPRPAPSAKRQRSAMEEDGEENCSRTEDCKMDDSKAEDEEDEEPVARCACQVVYDPTTQTFYMHGGNAGYTPGGSGVEKRLDDFWSMRLERPSHEEVIRRASFEIRRQQFREMCEEAAPVKALSFLQNEVSAVVNHEDQDESTAFRSLLSHLFAQPSMSPVSQTSASSILNPEHRIPATASKTSASSSFSSGSGSGSGGWTSELPTDEDTIMTDAGAENGRSSRNTQSRPRMSRAPVEDDPHELELRGGEPLSGDLFRQRTEIFESLLKYIDRDGTQPPGSLLDMIGST